MNESSLNKTINMVISGLDNLDINRVDKVELMINLKKFLDPKHYKENIKILQKERK